jgi:hypothetical protein
VVLYKLNKDIFEVCSKLKKGKVTSFSRNCNNCRGKKFPPKIVKKNEYIGCHQESDYTDY